MLICDHKNLKLIEIFLSGHGPKLVWSAWSQDSKMNRWNKVIFCHAVTNSGKLKIASIIFECAWSKMAMTF